MASNAAAEFFAIAAKNSGLVLLCANRLMQGKE
jgi:hypothetical protein